MGHGMNDILGDQNKKDSNFEQFYNFYLHDLHKNYAGGVSKHYQTYREMLGPKKQDKDKDRQAGNEEKKEDFEDAYEAELEEQEAFESYMGVIDMQKKMN